MSTPSLQYRIASLRRRVGAWLHWHVIVPIAFMLTTKNWRPFFSDKPDKSDTTYYFRSGYSLTVPAGSTNINPYIAVWLNHVYDHGDIAWNDAKTIIDIGAHIGAFSLYAAKKAPHAKIFSYEPDPVTEGYLRKNITQNHCEHRIKSNLAAVGGAEGTGTLHVLPSRSEANSMYRTLEGGHTIPVRVTMLQKIFDDENIEECDLLKMNAEGVEYEIFYGLPVDYLRRIKVIVMNYHVFVKKPRCTPQELQAYLESHGFAVTEQGKRIFVAVRR